MQPFDANLWAGGYCTVFLVTFKFHWPFLIFSLPIFMETFVITSSLQNIIRIAILVACSNISRLIMTNMQYSCIAKNATKCSFLFSYGEIWYIYSQYYFNLYLGGKNSKLSRIQSRPKNIRFGCINWALGLKAFSGSWD